MQTSAQLNAACGIIASVGNSQAQRIRRPDRFLARRKDRKKEPITQGVRALGPAVGLGDIDDVAEELFAGVETDYYEVRESPLERKNRGIP
jgi:hypothetical protein